MFRRLLLVSLVLCAPVFGQQPPEVIKTQLVTVALNVNETTLYYRTGEEVKEFAAGMNGLGDPFPYVGPRRFILHTTKEAFEPVKEGEKPPVPAAFIDLPTGSARVLLVCVPIEKSLRLIAYDIAKNSMKDGDYKVFNFSKSNLSVILGEKRFLVPTSKDVQVSDASWQAGVLDIPCKIGIIQPDNKSVKPAYSSVWGHRPIRRNMVFLFDGVRSANAVQVRRFYDIILPERPQAAAE